jgi:hypothetical protein
MKDHPCGVVSHSALALVAIKRRCPAAQLLFRFIVESKNIVREERGCIACKGHRNKAITITAGDRRDRIAQIADKSI